MTATDGRYSGTEDDRAATFRAILDRIEAGALTAQACTDEGVHEATLRRWLAAWDAETGATATGGMGQQSAQRVAYMRARSIAADALAEEAVRIAQSGEGDAQDRRLAYDALRWLAGKRRPQEYGDKQTVEHTGTVGHLHLDALRAPRIAATARIDSSDNTLRDTPLLPTPTDAHTIEVPAEVPIEPPEGQ